MAVTVHTVGLVWECNSRSCAARHSFTWLCTGTCTGHISVFIMPVYILEHSHQLTETMKNLTQDFISERKIHVCKIRHRDVLCSSSAQMLHDGAWDIVSVLYISHDLRRGVKKIVRDLLHYFPGGDDNLDEGFIFTCPGCGVPFAQQ